MNVKSREAVTVGSEVAGLASISAGCFVLWLWLGLIVTGLSLIALGWMLGPDEAA
jgi:hypothetical protein